jgi:hypothetical protein
MSGLYGRPIQTNHGFATGLVIVYWIKLGLASYVIAYYQFGFRLPALPFDVAAVIDAIQRTF